MKCHQCGLEIIDETAPAGFCCESCAEVHTAIHDAEFNRAKQAAA